LNVCLNTFLAFSPKFTTLHHQVTGNNVYLNIKHIKKQKSEEQIQQEEEKKPSKLAIGVEGGFAYGDSDLENNVEYEELLTLVCLDPINHVIPLPNPDLPTKIQMAVDAILAASSVERKQDLQAWEGDVLTNTPHANNLPQIGDKKIPASGWKCHSCDLTENLWLCLSCGEISCGRKFFDGSGGNNHGVTHYQQTGHPLVVKLGTIENAGEKADVYSYPEDNMVADEHLVKHLEYFGINVLELKKTERTMAELELDQNLSFDFSRIQESDKILTPLFGSGFTGLRNLGNSCYLASVMQTLFSIEEFQKRFFDRDMSVYTRNTDIDNLEIQLRKLAYGLLVGSYSQPIESETKEETSRYQEGIPPKSFKAVVGKNHPEFSTMKQQDAVEFLQHLFVLIERSQQTNPISKELSDPVNPFRYNLEERYVCPVSQQVKYMNRSDNVLSVPVPLEAAINLQEYEEYTKREKQRKEQEEKDKKITVDNVNSRPVAENKEREPVVRPRVPMKACLDSTAEVESVPGFYSSAIKRKTSADKTSKLATFPDYLVVQVRRFILDGWVPKKLDVFIEDPQEIDISNLRGTGLQPNETLLADEQEQAPQATEAPKLNVDQSIVAALMDMGFSELRSQKAAINTHNAGVEQAMNWVFDHNDDADIDDPLPTTSNTASKASVSVDDDAIEQIVMMGIERDAAILALKNTDNNVERAVDWVFNHIDEMAQLLQEDKNKGSSSSSSSSNTASVPSQPKQNFTDGSGKYDLIAFISHIGTNTNCGHYVAHIKKKVEDKDQWVLFNDSKVALSEEPPFDMGYLYVYKRRQA
jgi:ubiquitin carboxyl-terminal hydrolase 5/13